MQNVFSRIQATATNPHFVVASVALGVGVAAYRAARRSANRQQFAKQTRRDTETIRGFTPTAEQAASLQDPPLVAPIAEADRRPGLTPGTATMEAPFIHG